MTQLSGEQSAVPELRTPMDVAIAAKIAFAVPSLNDTAGWNVAFGRELNASDDRRHFVARPRRDGPAPGLRAGHYPIVEGKQIQPFRVDVAASRFSVPARVAATLLDPRRTFAHPRLAYRDVASSTNRLTLIAAIIPARAITTHTLFCLKGNVEPALQQFLCAVFNSFVANYLVRLRVGMHVTVSIIEQLRVPVVARDTSAFREIAALAASLGRGRADGGAAAILQARVARLYGLNRTEFHHVLGTFPLIPIGEREAAAAAFEQEEP